MAIDRTPGERLLEAVEKGKVEAVVQCLAEGPYMEERDIAAFTPLIRAAYDNSFDIARLLLGKGADIHATCEEGWTAVSYAIANRHFEMAWMLAGHGANLDYLDFEIGEDLPLHRESMEKVVRTAYGAGVWRDWEGFRLLQQTIPAKGLSMKPRL